ncbi:MAG: transposase [Ectothiorhodospiraceae bacterium AqS1]|nr:transposase [Ectothiorhodospiraceae bacterium AqS1]
MALPIRHDNGSQVSQHCTFRNEIRWLGIDSSPSFVRSPQGNGCVERFIRTIKENLLWPEMYSCLEDLQRALQRFKDKYDEKWLVKRHRYRSPGQFTRDEDETQTVA